jgi:hypothetical protein
MLPPANGYQRTIDSPHRLRRKITNSLAMPFGHTALDPIEPLTTPDVWPLREEGRKLACAAWLTTTNPTRPCA